MYICILYFARLFRNVSYRHIQFFPLKVIHLSSCLPYSPEILYQKLPINVLVYMKENFSNLTNEVMHLQSCKIRCVYNTFFWAHLLMLCSWVNAVYVPYSAIIGWRKILAKSLPWRNGGEIFGESQLKKNNMCLYIINTALEAPEKIPCLKQSVWRDARSSFTRV